MLARSCCRIARLPSLSKQTKSDVFSLFNVIFCLFSDMYPRACILHFRRYESATSVHLSRACVCSVVLRFVSLFIGRSACLRCFLFCCLPHPPCISNSPRESDQVSAGLLKLCDFEIASLAVSSFVWQCVFVLAFICIYIYLLTRSRGNGGRQSRSLKTVLQPKGLTSPRVLTVRERRLC